MKKIDPIFVSALYYGINKAIVNIIGTGGQVLGREASRKMLELLKEEDIIKENMKDEDIKDTFVNIFGLSEDLKIENNNDEVIFHVVRPTLSLFLERIAKEKIPLYICPFMYLLSEIYSYNKGYNLMFKNVLPEGIR
ncbi:hypothetical protein [Methanofervidicoccus abyssi]|uniref:Uncharacterized protein n=1 Tax=Methanofervidicoccus abyssi TaxID=2082189 RepID=A0A401HQ38_9EURY|nr:hypothetical protein [Methanofervidicoccus abyssi]GBF36315.1 hypothetical protein MHHB_P0545 [Methanofervidicoccus abyssi]